MDVRPGGPPLVEPILITRWIRLAEGRPATLRGTRHVRRTRQTIAPACLEFSVEEPLPAVSPKAVDPQYS
jgi:hypothetical protein